jgi:mannosyl-oligosaccharide alpha-1,2-mannosidase
MRIYNRLISSPLPSAAELVALDDELIEQGWLASLPPSFRDDTLPSLPAQYLLGHSISRWRFRLQRIIMYRPFLIKWAQDGLAPSSTGPSSSSFSWPSASPPPPSSSEMTAETIATTRCFKAAQECIACIFQFWSTATHTRLAAWYVL